MREAKPGQACRSRMVRGAAGGPLVSSIGRPHLNGGLECSAACSAACRREEWGSVHGCMAGRGAETFLPRDGPGRGRKTGNWAAERNSGHGAAERESEEGREAACCWWMAGGDGLGM